MKKEIEREKKKLDESMAEFDRCKRKIQLTVKVSQLKLKQFTGKILSGDNGDITPSDGEKKMTAIGM